MYIPEINLIHQSSEAIAFMQRYSFATLVTSENNFPIATHLPFVVSLKKDQVYLTSHLAKANAQWKQFADCRALVIFQEPHAYISPKLYDKTTNVPTWDYIAVHAYGEVKIIKETESVIKALEQMIDTYESGYKDQWKNISEKYKLALIREMVAFEIKVTELQGKQKLSQNKTKNERKKIIESLSQSPENHDREIAEYMQRLLNNTEQPK